MGIMDIFKSAHDDVPLHERDILEIGAGRFDDYEPEGYDGRVVNFNTYLDDGRPPQIDGLRYQDQYIDWDSDDAYTRALETVRANTFERIENSPELQELLAKDSWNREDRVSWEKGVSEIISDEHKKIPGLSEYRNEIDIDKYPNVERRVTRLNDLSSDIENDTGFIEHDCESMSIFEGVILQQVDNSFLPENAPDGDYRVASNYFYAVGRTNFNPEFNGPGGHAYIVSSATTNVIEATSRINPYNDNANPNMTFEDFIRGDMIVNADASIYTGFHHSVADITRYRFESGEISADAIYEQIPLKGDITQERYDDAPPEAQILIEMKTAIAELETLRDEGCVLEHGSIDDVIAERKAEFNDMIEDLADDANIQDTMKYARTVIQHQGTYVRPEVRLEAAYDKVKEMHPDWDQDQVDEYVFRLEIGFLPPDVDGQSFGGSSSDHDDFVRAKTNQILEELGIDGDEARAIWNTQEAQQAIFRSDMTRDEILAHPEYSKALVLHETAREIGREFPTPGTARAYGQVGKRLDAFEKEYEEFTGEKETCESLDASVSEQSALSSILPRF